MTSLIHFVSIHKMFGLEIFDHNQNTKSHFIQIGQLQDIIFASVKFHQNGFLLILLYSNLYKTNFTVRIKQFVQFWTIYVEKVLNFEQNSKQAGRRLIVQSPYFPC